MRSRCISRYSCYFQDTTSSFFITCHKMQRLKITIRRKPHIKKNTSNFSTRPLYCICLWTFSIPSNRKTHNIFFSGKTRTLVPENNRALSPRFGPPTHFSMQISVADTNANFSLNLTFVENFQCHAISERSAVFISRPATAYHLLKRW